MTTNTRRSKWLLSFFIGLSILLIPTETTYAKRNKKLKNWISEKDALQVLRKVFAGKPEKSDYREVAMLFKLSRQDFLVPLIKIVLKEASRNKNEFLSYIYFNIDDRSIIPDVIDFVRCEKEGLLRLLALKILRKIPDKRALPVAIERCLYDSYKWEYDDEMHRIRVKSTFINSLMLLHTLTNGEIGIEQPGRRIDVRLDVDLDVDLKIEKKKDEIINKCEKWWAKNKEEFFKELEKEHGAEEVKRYRETALKKSDNNQENAPEEKKTKEKEPSPAKNTNKSTDQDLTPGAEKVKPPPVEKPKPEAKPVVEEAEPSAGWLLPALIVADIVLAVIAAYFLLLRRKK